MLTKKTLLLAAGLSICSTVAQVSSASTASSNATAQTGKSAFKYSLYTTNVLAWASGQRSGLVQDGQGPMAKALERLLKTSTEHVNIAIYGIQHQEWAFSTLKGLVARGVVVEAVVDQKSGEVGDWSPENFTYPDTARLPLILSQDAVVPDQSESGKARSSTIMHDKFVTVDHRFVWTGSSNMSHTCMGSEYNANSSILIESPELAALYETEFHGMHDEKVFSRKKEPIENLALRFSDGTKVSVFFSPQDDAIHAAVLPLIENAKKTLDIGMFYLTHEAVLEALKDASARGVKVRLIADAVAAAHPSSHNDELRAAGVQVRVENWGGKMHMKSAIADHKTVIIGSMNWTEAGNTANDENTLLIENNAKLAGDLTSYFESLWSNLSHTSISVDPRAEGPQSINSCFDGIDNDHDGLVDLQESACKTAQQ
jgi:phosphatidylserine/phosphatidylglycerophosphate/cardiolipin synthase-like enzyme